MRTPDPEDISTTFLAKLIGVSIGRVSQLSAEGVIKKLPNGRYPPEAVAQFIKFKESSTVSTKKGEYAELLEKEKYREKKRENDAAEGLLAPIEVIRETLEKVASQIVPQLEMIPLNLKRKWPDIFSGDLVRDVQAVIAECRNVIADIKTE